MKRGLKSGTCLAALAATACADPASAHAIFIKPLSRVFVADQPDGASSPAAEARPKNQTAIFSLPVLRDGNPLGELDARVSKDGNVAFDGKSLATILEPLLSQAGIDKLSQVVANSEYVTSQSLDVAGFHLRFDINRLEVLVDSIDPDLQKIIDLSPPNETSRFQPTVEPAEFSAYLSLAGNLEYTEGQFGEGLTNPDILGFGAIRSGRFALQYEGGLAERGADGYGLYRRFVRGTYEDEKRNLRISAGDLQVESLPILGAQLLGGAGMERRRRIFSPFDPTFQIGGRRILVNSPSTIEIVSNGQTIRNIPVDPGVYDLQQLPLVSGANNVDIIVRDAAGRSSVTNFNYFYDPVELEVGDYEYGAYVGMISNFDSLEPSYRNDPAFSGFYRRAFSASLLIGGALQASKDSQAIAAELRWVPQIVPGSIESQVAISNGSRGIGIAGRVGYRWARTSVDGGQQFSLLADFETANFEPVSRPVFLNEKRFSLTANYGQNVNQKTYISAGVNYFKRGDSAARITTFADIIRQFTPRLRGILGAEFGKNDGYGTSFGVKAGITLLLGRTSRATASFESRRSLYRASYSKGQENRVGSIGYDANIQSSDGRNLADASVRYTGNRFDGSLLVSGGGSGFGNFTDSRRAQLQLSTSLAFADGAFGVGRPISDAFAIVRPHPAIKGEVVVGNRLNGGEYQAKSGLLGGAVIPNLIGYQTRELLYDIDSDDAVFGTGNGVDRVRVATGGGAQITVGDFRIVSALGTILAGGKPVALASGTVTSKTDEGFPEGQFFTNYRGRFSIIGLAPGGSYDINLNDGRKFSIQIPKDSGSLLRLSDIAIEEVEE